MITLIITVYRQIITYFFPTDRGAVEASSGSDDKAVKCKPTSDRHNNGQSSAAAACTSEVNVLVQDN